MKVLIAGLGSVGQRHLRNLRQLLGESVEILAYRVNGSPQVITTDMTIAAGESVEAKYGVRSFRDLHEALATRPDAVFVCNPTSEHMATALAAARAGCHLFIEKPLASSAAQVEELIALTESRGLVTAVGYQLRCHPALQRVREILRAGTIGHVRSVRAEMGEYLPDAHPYEDYRTSYAARAELGGGVILCYIHELDYLCWLFGQPRRVFTIGGRLGELAIDVEDTALSSLECVVAGRTIAIQVHLSFLQRPSSRSCEIVGDAGTIRADLRGGTVSVAGPGLTPETTTFALERNQLFIDELRHFLSAVAGTPAPVVSAREAAVSLRVALAAKASLASGRVVTLP